MDEKQIPSLAEIHIASRHLRAIAVPMTPIITNGSLNRLTKKNIYLKCENFQRTGSFKTRGTLNVILNAMKIEPNLKGFVTCSSGNYGIAVSYAASLVKRPCVVVVSDDTPKYVITAIKQYGAEIITCKSSHQDICSRISKEREYFLVPSSAHPDVIAGNQFSSIFRRLYLLIRIWYRCC
jgi:threonine dehydratase